MVSFVDQVYQANFEPRRVALSYEGKEYTYQDLERLVNGFAGLISSKGIGAGDRVILSCQNSPEFVVAYLGIIRAGATVIPLNIALTPEEIMYILRDAQAKAVAIHENIALVMAKRLGIDPQKQLQSQIILLNNALLDQLGQSGDEFVAGERGDYACFLYTSGTTGYPKGAMLTHRNLLSNVESLQKVGRLTPDDAQLCVLPMFHSFAWTACVLLTLYAGGRLVIKEAFQPKEVLEAIPKERITIFCGAPPMYAVLCKVGQKEIFQHMRFTVSGGSALPAQVLEQFEKEFQVPLVEGYGLSEASPVVTLNPIDGVRKPGSIGLALPDVSVRLVDDNMNDVPVGEVGELAVKGPNVMAGYFNLPNETAQALRDGWLLTGDLAKQDEEGYLYIVDRKKELVVVSGFNVYPREVETALMSHPKVQEAAVIGVPDEVRGEAVKAFVVVEEGQELTEKELRDYLKERLASYKRPRIYQFIDQLPKTATQKVMKKMLK